MSFLQYCFCCLCSVLWPRGMWDIAPEPGIKPAPPALESEVLTTRPCGKSLIWVFYHFHNLFHIKIIFKSIQLVIQCFCSRDNNCCNKLTKVYPFYYSLKSSSQLKLKKEHRYYLVLNGKHGMKHHGSCAFCPEFFCLMQC